MIATRHFVFVHLHKSGGTFVNDWLRRFFPDAREIGYHLPRRLIPPDLGKLPVVGLVRNPWTYYVSWYAFQSSRPRPNALFQILSDGGRRGFEPTIRNMLALSEGGPQLDACVAALPAAYTNRGINLPGPELAAIRGSGLGFYSFLYHYMYAGEGPLRVVPMEKMRDELPETLRSIGAPLSDAAALELASAPPLNTTNHGSPDEYYSAALRDLVYERDGYLIDRYGYSFDA